MSQEFHLKIASQKGIEMMKLQSKISEPFRTTKISEAFCRIGAYISTIRKNSLQVIRWYSTGSQGNAANSNPK